MNTRVRRLALILLLTTVLLSLAPTAIHTALSISTGGKIDLFTKKEPYNGAGPNARSDAFSSGEEIQICALVTYNDYPMGSILVAFAVHGPSNPAENITFSRSAFTNESGVAVFSFRISHLNETTFGEWTIVGNAEIGESIFTDTLTFKVGWIVEIVAIRTINEDYAEQEVFARGNNIGIEVAVRNIAMTERTATLTFVIYDSLNMIVNATRLDNFLVPPNETLTFASVFLYIPKSAHVGNATVYSGSYTAPPDAGGVPYSPEKPKRFLITAQEYLLQVRTEPADVTFISGGGWYEKNANVTLTAPSLIMSYAGVRYKFVYWDIDGLIQELEMNSIIILMDNDHIVTAHYVLQYYLTVLSEYGTPNGAGWYNVGSTAYASLNSGVFDYGNDTRRVFTSWSVDGSGDNYAQSDPILMNSPKTAVAGWKTQYYLAVRTIPTGITTVLGEGWYDEFSNITVYAPAVSSYLFEYWDLDGSVKDEGVNPIIVYMNAPHIITAHYTQTIMYTLTIVVTEGGTTDPPPGTSQLLSGSTVQVTAQPNENYVFAHWELDGLNVGSTNPYTVVMNRNHTLKAVFSTMPATYFVPDWYYWLLLPLLALILLLIALLYRRGKRKREGSYSGWTGWYHY